MGEPFVPSSEDANCQDCVLKADLDALRARLADIENATRFAREEGCGDEKHCACVPLLRVEVARLAASQQYACKAHRGMVRKGEACCWCQLERLRDEMKNLAIGNLEAQHRAALENKRLREALEKYGKHEWHCATQNGEAHKGPCDCGLGAALA